MTTITVGSASGSASGNHAYTSSGTASSWSQTGNYAAGNGTSSGTSVSSGVTLSESMQSQWQEGYTFRALPGLATTMAGSSSGSSHSSGDATFYNHASGSTSSASSYGSGYAYTSGSGNFSASDGQDHYDDVSSSWQSWAADGTHSSGGASSDHVWGVLTSQRANNSWWSSQGSGSGSSGSWSSGGSGSNSYDATTYTPGFGGVTGARDGGWSWGQGWYGAGRNGPLGPTPFSGVGYVFTPGNPVSVTAPNNQANAEGQTVSLQIQASDWSVGSGSTTSSSGGPFSYSETGIPPGLSINQQTGLITGTINANAFTAGPIFEVTVTASDSGGHSASRSFLWVVSEPLTLINPGDQSGTEGQAASLTPQATDAAGALLTWTESGLPSGLSISPDGGAISGTPAAGSAGAYIVTLTATDSGGASASQMVVWSIAPAVTLTDPGVQSRTEGGGVSLQVQAHDATGGALTFSETGLPPGLALSSSGLVTGTISAGDAAAGFYSATITATDGTYSASQTVVWKVSSAVNVANLGSQSSTQGDAVSLQIQATDASGATPTFSATGLPTGLSISSSGLISGTASAVGFYDVTITASDGAYNSSQSFGWDVAAGPVSLADPQNRSNTEGDAVSLQLHGTDASGLPVDYSADGLPAGLSLNAQTGAITGMIAAGAAGFYVTTITATDADFNSASQTFTWSVDPAVSVTDPGGQQATEGGAAALQIQATDSRGGTPTFSATGLPPGLSISSNGQITGTIAAGAADKGFYQAKITATDGAYSAKQTLVWSVAPALTITDPGSQTNVENEAVAVQVQATDALGTPSFTADGLPPGLSISNSGQITGTVSPGAAAKGSYKVTIKATDGVYSASQTLIWKVAGAPLGTWSGDIPALDAAFAELGRQGRMAFDYLVELVGQNGASNAGGAAIGRPGLRLLASHVMTAVPSTGADLAVLHLGRKVALFQEPVGEARPR